MHLNAHPLIAPRSAAEISHIVHTHIPHGPVEKALPGTLLRHAGIAPEITKAALGAGRFPDCADEIVARHAAFLAAASEADLVNLILRRAISETRHVDFDTWGRRLDARVSEALGVPAGTVQDELDAGTCEEGGLARLSDAVFAAYLASADPGLVV